MQDTLKVRPDKTEVVFRLKLRVKKYHTLVPPLHFDVGPKTFVSS